MTCLAATLEPTFDFDFALARHLAGTSRCAHRNGFGILRPPPRTATAAAENGLAIMDRANAECAVFQILGRRPQAKERIDLRRLRKWQQQEFGIGSSEYVLSVGYAGECTLV